MNYSDNQNKSNFPQPVDMMKLSEQFHGIEYRKLVQEQLRRSGNILQDAIRGYIEELDEDERQLCEYMIDIFNSMGSDKLFWRRDCGEVLFQIYSMYLLKTSARNRRPKEHIGFAIFQIITLNFAYQATQSIDVRKHMGIRRSLLKR